MRGMLAGFLGKGSSMELNPSMLDELISRIAKRAKTTGMATSSVEDKVTFPPISGTAFDEEERRLGIRLPVLIKRLYTEVGNGGFGPGEGLLSLRPLSAADHPISYFHGKFRAARNRVDAEWPSTIVPFCHWGDLILSCMDMSAELADPPVIRFEPNMSKLDTLDFLQGRRFRGTGMIPEKETLSGWLEDWLEGREMLGRPYNPLVR